ncbi:MAG: pyruvate, water dikinase regulatory protein [Anaerolineae bacterium]
MKEVPIYVVSGGEGTSGEQLLRTALAQFEESAATVEIVPHVRTPEEVEAVVNRAYATGGMIVHTLVDGGLRQHLIALARELNVEAIDLMGTLLSSLSKRLGRQPLGQPGLYRQFRQQYFERIEAIEFTVAHDDGRNVHELDQAEIVLTGISRVGKTPLAMYLSIQGWKTANVPLVPGIDPPPELFAVDSRRVVGLTIDPMQLMAHRTWRQKRLKLGHANYVDLEAIYQQLEAAHKVFRRGGFAILDITNRPIEESAADVIAVVTRRLKRQPPP